jgi:anti-anti-sigma factor
MPQSWVVTSDERPEPPSADPVAAPTGDETWARLQRPLALVDQAPDAIVVLDADAGRFIAVNPAAELLFGLAREELLTVGPVDLSPAVQPDGRPSAEAAAEYIRQALAGGQPRFDWTHRRADGGVIACELTLVRLRGQDGNLLRCSILDVSDRRAAAEASAARLQAMVAGLNAIVWERDAATSQIRYINERAEQLLGYPVSQWFTDETLWTDMIEPADRDRVLATVRDGMAAGGDFALDYRVRTRDGRRVWLQHLGHVAHPEGGAATVHAVLIDVTAAKRREQASTLLATAGRLLAAPGSVEQRLTAVADLVAGELGEWAAVWLRGDDDRYRPVAAAPTAAARRVLALPPWQVPAELEARLMDGNAFTIGEVTHERLHAATEGAHYEALSSLGSSAWLVAPLAIGGAVVGVLTCTAGPDTGFDEPDVVLAADLGQRLAMMVASERAAAQRRRLHDLTVALSAAGTMAEAASAVSVGLQTVLGAEVVSVCSVEDDGLLHTVDVAGYPTDRLPQFAAMRLTAALPLTDAARTRTPVWLPNRSEALRRYPLLAPAMLADTHALAALPLLDGERLVGALGVSFTKERPFDQDERGFLLTVAGQVAVAFERATLADARREMADTLQRSLLPGELPGLDGVGVTARYLPAVEGTRAGGDWYDVLAVDGGRVALVVGDVVGHGAPAAAVMGQLRAALATLLLAGFPPHRALEHLDRFAARQRGAQVSTVACLLLDPRTGRLSYSSAGHPPPLLLHPDGDLHLDGATGPALGVTPTGGRSLAWAAVQTGATLLLYTDGLVEHRGTTFDDGVERLVAAATSRRSLRLPALLDGVLTDLVPTDGAADDIAVVALRLQPAPLRLGVRAEPSQLSAIRRTAAEWAAGAGMDPDSIEDLQLALGEAAGNAVEHAYRDAPVPGRVTVELDLDADGALTVVVADTGAWRPAPQDPGHRGRGLQMIGALAEQVELSHGLSGTVVRFRFVPGSAAAVASRATPPPPEELHDGAPATVTAVDGGEVRCLRVSGDLDLAGVIAVRDEMFAELAHDRRPVTVDLTDVAWLTSVGLGLLLEIAERAGPGTQFLLPDPGPARRVLDMTGLTAALDR